ncbi:MAG: hypothetical protein K1X29_02900 [Bdellovibrionales bacterium]|nr:hypothetical protein [Bdellovibrionales bacterium]
MEVSVKSPPHKKIFLKVTKLKPSNKYILFIFVGFSISSCSLYQSDGRKLLQDRASENSKGNFSVSDHCNKITPKDPVVFPLTEDSFSQEDLKLRYSDSQVVIYQSILAQNQWVGVTTKNHCQFSVQNDAAAKINELQLLEFLKNYLLDLDNS